MRTSESPQEALRPSHKGHTGRDSRCTRASDGNDSQNYLAHEGRLVSCEVYASVETLEGVATFIKHHVFAAWDFMCRLKSRQRCLTRVSVPWIPVGDRASRRLVNELVLGRR